MLQEGISNMERGRARINPVCWTGAGGMHVNSWFEMMGTQADQQMIGILDR